MAVSFSVLTPPDAIRVAFLCVFTVVFASARRVFPPPCRALAKPLSGLVSFVIPKKPQGPAEVPVKRA